MRTARHLYRRLCEIDHLESAAEATVKGKRRRPDVAWFLFTLDQQLADLHGELLNRRFEPSALELVGIRDPKPRLIARIPIRDRVLHTAIVDLRDRSHHRQGRPAPCFKRPGGGFGG